MFRFRRFENHAFYHAMLAAFGRSGCPLCRMKAETSDKYLDVVLYESITAVDFRRDFRDARGFCPRHTRETAAFENALGASILYQEVLSDALERWWKRGMRGVRIRRARAQCPVCAAEERLLRDFRDAVGAYWHEPAFQTAYKASDGLCVPHVEMVLRKAPSKARRFVYEAEAEKVRVLVARLDEFIRKCDYRFTSEPRGDEGRAWLDAISKCAGGVPEDD